MSYGSQFLALTARGALAGCALAGCSAREACLGADSYEDPGVLVEAMLPEQSEVLGGDANIIERRVRVRLTGLPRLSPAGSTVNQATLRASAEWSYAGATEQTPNIEYPIVRAQWDEGQWSPHGPFVNSLQVVTLPFGYDCTPHDERCCEDGEPECEREATFRLERVQDNRFPDLEVRWHYSFQGWVNDCPLEEGKVAVQLEEVSP
jgi:hypothetical protein